MEHQAVTLSEYEVSMLGDHKHVQTVSHARAHETPFRSPQLTLIDLGPGEWLLYWKTPDRAQLRRKRHITDITQLPLFEQEMIAAAAGGAPIKGSARTHSHLSLIWHKHD